MTPPLQDFVVSDLTARQLPEALPLVQLTWPEIRLDAWQRFAGTFADKPSDSGAAIVGLSDTGGGLCGVFACRRDRYLGEGHVLSIPLFIAVDVVDSMGPARALLDAAQDRARACGCTRLHIHVGNGQDELAGRLRSLGMSHAALVYSLALDVEAA
jgi:hypothetical protein